jgi:hypothetical protein
MFLARAGNRHAKGAERSAPLASLTFFGACTDTASMGFQLDSELAGTSSSRLAALLVLPSLIGGAVYCFGLPLEPDASYYVGGFSLYPSPLGTLLGTAGGYSGLAVLNAFTSFAVILLVGLIARHLGGQPLLAEALALLIARGSWFDHWGMDTPGVAFLLGAALLHLRGRSKWAVALVGLAAATHLATLPLALGALLVHVNRRSTAAMAVGLVTAGTAFAYFTGYRAGFALVHEPHAFVEGAQELVLAGWPLLLLPIVATFHTRVRLLFLGSAVGAVLAGAVPASVGQVGLTRYALPCVFIAVAGARLRGSLGTTAPQMTAGYVPPAPQSENVALGQASTSVT